MCLVALMLRGLLCALSRTSSHLRYVLACTALVFAIALPVVTSLWHLPASDSGGGTPALSNEEAALLPNGETQHHLTQSDHNKSGLPWRQRIHQHLESALPYTVMLWGMGVLALSIWHVGGFLRIYRLRTTHAEPIAGPWQTRVQDLATDLGIGRYVRVLTSVTLNSPAIVGCWKPSILFPLSALSGLAPDQIEALFLHELAHIRRYDYLVNLVQIVTEILGFYHPAIWWINKMIRMEREHCCDHIAAEYLDDRIAYARTLVSLEDLRLNAPRLVLGAAGQVKVRIQRLLGIDAQLDQQNVLSVTFVSLLLLVVLAYPLWAGVVSTSESWTSLFDGRSLAGWQQRGVGQGEFYVQDNQIVGSITKGTALFLCTQAHYSDFELEFEVKADPNMNAGVQFRSHVYDTDTTAWIVKQGRSVKRVFKPGQVYGYQVEISSEGDRTSGSIWDEARRVKWLANTSSDPIASRALKESAWNSYRVVCRGDHIRTWVNGILCSDLHDNVSQTGFIGLQAYNRSSAESLSVYWRKLRIRELRD